MQLPIRQLKLREMVASRCIQGVYYFDLCTGHDSFFWPYVQNSIGEAVCLLWCHLFGSRGDDLHFTKFFEDAEVNQFGSQYQVDAVKNRLLISAGFDEAEYLKFWEEVKLCRDKFVAHRDVDDQTVIFPRIDQCRVMSEELRDILSECIDEWARVSDDPKIASMREYYRWHPNRAMKDECEKQFKFGIQSVYSGLS